MSAAAQRVEETIAPKPEEIQPAPIADLSMLQPLDGSKDLPIGVSSEVRPLPSAAPPPPAPTLESIAERWLPAVWALAAFLALLCVIVAVTL